MATRYVNTASSPGGDGTTNATSGANRAYASLAEFEATLTGTLSEAWTSHCSGATADTTAVTFGGFTPSEDHYVEVIGDYSGEGYDEDQYHMVRTANDGAIIRVNVGYMRLRRLQIYHAATANGDYNPSAIFVSSGLSGITLVDRCLLRGTELSTQGRPRGLVGLSTVHAVNTVFWGWRGASSTSDGFQRAGGAGSLAYHCTAYDCRRGFTTGDDGQSGANQLRLINCVAAACVDGFAAGWVFGTGSDYNASDLASDAPGANSRNSQTFSWVDAAIGLLRPTESDAAVVGYGTDLSGDGTRPVSVDITGTTRPNPPSIGAYEPTGGGGPDLKSASDSLTLTLTDANVLLASLLQTDTLGLTVSEAAALVSSLTATDAGTLASTETSSIDGVLQQNDILSVSVFDVIQLAISLFVTDAQALICEESPAINVNVQGTESLALFIQSIESIASEHNAADTYTLTEAENVTLSSNVMLVDDLTMQLLSSAVRNIQAMRLMWSTWLD